MAAGDGRPEHRLGAEEIAPHPGPRRAVAREDEDDARSAFGARMLDACSVELLADVRDKVRREAGEVQALGTPAISVRDGYTVVDIPVALERADGIGRVVLNADRQVAGFFIRPKEAVP